jgi:hypothetical protein
LAITLSYTDAVHGREYNYINRDSLGIDRITTILSQPQVGGGGQVIWSSTTLALNARFEVFNNAYAVVNISWSDVQAYDDTNPQPIVGEVVKTAQGYLDLFTSPYLQGKQTTVSCGFNIGF